MSHQKTPTLARPVPCKVCAGPTRAVSHTHRSYRPKQQQRPVVTCTVCGIATTAKSGTCRPCNGRHIAEPTAEHALTGGRWVGHNGIQIWRKDDAA